MKFKRSKAIAENTFEEEIIKKGKKDKQTKLYGTYIFRIFAEESSEYNKFTSKQLSQKILEKFETYIELSTLQSYIKLLKEQDSPKLLGDSKGGYYFSKENGPIYISEENRLFDEDIVLLVDTIRTLKNYPSDEIERIKNSLIEQCCETITQEYLLGKDIVNSRNDSESKKHAYFIAQLPKIIEEQRPILFKAQVKNSNFEVKYIKFHIYAAIPSGSTYILVGCRPGQDRAVFIYSSSIKDFKVLYDETFNKEKLHLYPSVLIGENKIAILKKENKDDFIFHTHKERLEMIEKLKNKKNTV